MQHAVKHEQSSAHVWLKGPQNLAQGRGKPLIAQRITRIAKEARTPSVQVEHCDDLALLLGVVAGLQQQPAIMEGKHDDLLYMTDDAAVADPVIDRACSITTLVWYAV